MDRKNKAVVFFIFLLLFAVMFVTIPLSEAKEIMGVKVVSEKEAAEISEDKELVHADTYGELRINGYAVPYDKNINKWYIPQNIENDVWAGKITVSGDDVRVVLLENTYYQEKKSAIKNNISFEFMLYNNNTYSRGNIVYTGLPAVVLNTETVDELQGNLGQIRVYEPASSEKEAYRIQQSGVQFYVRGGTSRWLEKTGYRVRLLDDQGSTKKLSFVGMREDDDWILNALYTDVNRVREKLSSDLWNVIEGTGSYMEYVEVFIDDDYMGIYGLVEPIDYKQLGLNKSSEVLYKIKGWDVPTENDFQIYQNSPMCLSTEVKNAGREITAALWEPFKIYIQNLFESSDEEFQTAIDTYVDLQNLINIGLFTEIICGGDNTYKNQFVAAMQDENGYHFLKIPWDFDLTWGNQWDGNSDLNSSFNMERCKNNFLDTTFKRMRLLKVYDEEIQLRWKKIREEIYSLDFVTEKLEAYTRLLDDSGAYQREGARWPNSQVNSDVSQVYEFARRRIAVLDKRYGFAK